MGRETRASHATPASASGTATRWSRSPSQGWAPSRGHATLDSRSQDIRCEQPTPGVSCGERLPRPRARLPTHGHCHNRTEGDWFCGEGSVSAREHGPAFSSTSQHPRWDGRVRPVGLLAGRPRRTVTRRVGVTGTVTAHSTEPPSAITRERRCGCRSEIEVHLGRIGRRPMWRLGTECWNASIGVVSDQVGARRTRERSDRESDHESREDGLRHICGYSKRVADDIRVTRGVEVARRVARDR